MPLPRRHSPARSLAQSNHRPAARASTATPTTALSATPSPLARTPSTSNALAAADGQALRNELRWTEERTALEVRPFCLRAMRVCTDFRRPRTGHAVSTGGPAPTPAGRTGPSRRSRKGMDARQAGPDRSARARRSAAAFVVGNRYGTRAWACKRARFHEQARARRSFESALPLLPTPPTLPSYRDLLLRSLRFAYRRQAPRLPRPGHQGRPRAAATAAGS